jgi:cytochrome c-type biogenesis protein CcmH/NrfF
VAIRRCFADYLYLTLGAFDVGPQKATLEVTVNPLINWIWFGFGILAIGTILSLLPERAMAFATASVPQGAVTTSLLFLLIVGGLPGRAHAQHVENPQVVLLVPRTPVEKRLRDEIICMCGTCGRKRVGECTCSKAEEMRTEIAGLIAAGKSYDEVVDYYVTKYGSQEVLAAPIDKGFNRLAWFLPSAVGYIGILEVGSVAVRWTRHSRLEPTTGVSRPGENSPGDDAAAQQRREKLDDELRDLD